MRLLSLQFQLEAAAIQRELDIRQLRSSSTAAVPTSTIEQRFAVCVSDWTYQTASDETSPVVYPNPVTFIQILSP